MFSNVHDVLVKDAKIQHTLLRQSIGFLCLVGYLARLSLGAGTHISALLMQALNC